MVSGLFFCARGSLGAGSFHHELHVLRHQFLDLTVALDGGLEVGHLFQGHIAGNIAALFIALVIIVGPLRALAKHTDGAAIQMLDLGDVLEERFGRGVRIHGLDYMPYTYTPASKKSEKLD